MSAGVPSPDPALELLEEGRVEQAIDRGERGEFWKQVYRLPGEHDLGLVRKTLIGGPTRPPLVLVHGFAQNRYTWHTSQRSMVNWFAQRGWDVWNLEMRGHGRSRTQTAQGAGAFSDYVDDVARVARLFDGEAFFVGHSLGGAACYGAACSAPMAGVVGVGAIFSFAQHNPVLKLLGQITHELRGTQLIQGLTLKTRNFGHVLAKLYGLSDVLGYAFPISGWWPGSVEPDLLEERLVRGFDWTSVKVWLEMSRWAVTGVFDYEDDWRKLDLPVLVVAGDKDHLAPPGDAKRAYDLSGASDRTWLEFNHYDHEVHWGHLDLVLGRMAPLYVWPTIEAWVSARAP